MIMAKIKPILFMIFMSMQMGRKGSLYDTYAAYCQYNIVLHILLGCEKEENLISTMMAKNELDQFILLKTFYSPLQHFLHKKLDPFGFK